MGVTLRVITRDNVDAVLALKVAPAQNQFVAPNAWSLAEAQFYEESWHRAIYADDELVGFVLLWDDTLGRQPAAAEPQVSIWRLMIDQRFQRQGHGQQAVLQVMDYARSRPGVQTLQTSFVPGEGSPGDFYLRLGFELTGEVDEDELVVALRLHR